MVKVKGPNGEVYDLADRVAAGLVGGGNRGYEYASKGSGKSEDKSESKSSSKTSKSSSSSSKSK